MFKRYKYYNLQYQGKLCKKYGQKNQTENYTKCQQWLLWGIGDAPFLFYSPLFSESLTMYHSYSK